MSEAFISVPLNILELLQEGCRSCPFARNVLQETIRNGLDAKEEVKRINEECRGWESEKSPHDTLLESTHPALALSKTLEDNCPHPLS